MAVTFYCKPCRTGESTRVFIDGFAYQFESPVLIEYSTNKYELHVYIDSSGSMNNDSFNPPLSVQVVNKVPVNTPYTLFFPRDEQWVSWFSRSISRVSRRVILAFIDESSPYESRDGVYQWVGTGVVDSYGREKGGYVYVEGGLSSILLADLRDFPAAYKDGVCSYGHLFLVGGNQDLLQGAIHSYQAEMGGTGYNYEGIGYGANVSDRMGSLLSPTTDFYVKIYTLKYDDWAALRELIRDLTTTPFNSLIQDSLFSTLALEKHSDQEIDLSWTCGGRCPPGYCEISIPVPPYYCCIR